MSTEGPTDAPQIELEDMGNYDGDFNNRQAADPARRGSVFDRVCHWKGTTTAYLSAALFFAGYLISVLIHFGVLNPDDSQLEHKNGELQTRDAMLEHYNGDKTLVKIYSVEPTIYASPQILEGWRRKIDNRSLMLLSNFLCAFAWFTLIPSILAYVRSLGGFKASRQLGMGVCFAFGAMLVALQLIINLSLADQADRIAEYLFNHDTHSKMTVDQDHRWAEAENRLNDTSAWTALTISHMLIESSMSWLFALDNLALVGGFACVTHAALENRDGSCSSRLFALFSILGCLTCFFTFGLDIFRYTSHESHSWLATGKLFEGCIIVPLWLLTLGTVLAKDKNWVRNAGRGDDVESQPLRAI